MTASPVTSDHQSNHQDLVGPRADPAAASGTTRRTLSVVVCAYTLDRWDDLCAAVDSLDAQSVPPDEVLLVVDHDPLLLQRARAELRCRVEASIGARGLSGARNTAVGLVTGDVVAFLDDDATADPRWAERMLSAYEDDAVLGVAGHVVPRWASPRPRWFPDEFLWVVGCSYRGLPTGRAEVRNAIGANMSFTRRALLAAGAFAEGVGRVGSDAAGCEETELSIRARRRLPGGRILLEPGAVCHHTVTPDRTTRRYFRRRCRAEGRSKAMVSVLTGTGQALSSERSYLARTVPAAVLSGLAGALRGDLGAAARAAAVVEGVSLTAGAYLWTRTVLALRGTRGTAQG